MILNPGAPPLRHYRRPPRLRAVAVLNVGLGYLALGRDREASRALRRSLVEARALGLVDLPVRAMTALAVMAERPNVFRAGVTPGRSQQIRHTRNAIARAVPSLQSALRQA
jgi:hypothetical protein